MFEYSAVDAESEETTGKIEATTQVDAINKLKNQGLWPKQVIEESKGKLKASKNDRKKNRSRSKFQSKSKGSDILSSVLMGGGALGIVLYFVFSNQFTKKSKIIEAIKVNDPPVMSELLSPVADAKPELEGVNYDELKGRDGLFYRKASNIPYTGETYVLYPSGEIKESFKFKNGIIDGPSFSWHKNGQKDSEGNMKDGKFHGLQTSWYENGQKRIESTWKEFLRHGLETQWHENGQKESEVTYKDGKPEGLVAMWHQNGQKLSETTYKDGKLVGSQKWWNSKGESVDSKEEAKAE